MIKLHGIKRYGIEPADRDVLELSEARELRASYHHNAKKHDKLFASRWLAIQLRKKEDIYGNGFGERCRKWMRYVEDVELGGA